MSNQYTLTVTNNSTQKGDFCIFQEQPDSNAQGVITLAWLAKPAHPSTSLEFEWDLEYSFAWANTTDLKPGTIVKTSQEWDANVSSLNKVKFDSDNGTYTLNDQVQGTRESNLNVKKDKQAEVSVGISGKGAFIVPSQPNMNIVMTPKPTYWIVFGDFQEGEILDVEKITKNALRLQYDGTNSMNVEFTGKNRWNT